MRRRGGAEQLLYGDLVCFHEARYLSAAPIECKLNLDAMTQSDFLGTRWLRGGSASLAAGDFALVGDPDDLRAEEFERTDEQDIEIFDPAFSAA